jgi:hypothetical protein
MSKARHKTIPKELKKEMRWIESQGAKLVLGICESTRHKFSPGHIRLLRREDAGIKSVAYTGNGIMNFFIVCKNEEVFNSVIERYGKPSYD